MFQNGHFNQPLRTWDISLFTRLDVHERAQSSSLQRSWMSYSARLGIVKSMARSQELRCSPIRTKSYLNTGPTFGCSSLKIMDNRGDRPKPLRFTVEKVWVLSF